MPSGRNITSIWRRLREGRMKNCKIFTNGKLTFRDSGIYINSGADGKLTISADGTGTDDITLSGNVTLGAGLAFPRAAKTGAYTTTTADLIVGVDSSGGAVTITLGSATAVAGLVQIIKDEGGAAATNAITIATEGTETIDGSASTSISTNYGVSRIYSDGTNFFTF